MDVPNQTDGPIRRFEASEWRKIIARYTGADAFRSSRQVVVTLGLLIGGLILGHWLMGRAPWAAALLIIPLGGLGQFGANMTVFRYNDEMIVVDCGLMFPDEDLLGVDIAIPDLSYIEEHRDELVGIVLTIREVKES